MCLPFLRRHGHDGQAVEMRQLPVGDDEVVAAFGGAKQALAPVGGDVHHVAAFTQPLGKEPGRLRVVLDQQQVHEASKVARVVEFAALRIINIRADYERGRRDGRIYCAASAHRCRRRAFSMSDPTAAEIATRIFTARIHQTRHRLGRRRFGRGVPVRRTDRLQPQGSRGGRRRATDLAQRQWPGAARRCAAATKRWP